MLYLFTGKDNFRKQLRIKELKQKLIEPGMESMNFQELNNPKAQDLINIVQTPSWGFGNKVILVNEFNLLEDIKDIAEIENLIKAFSNLSENTQVILSSNKIDQRTKAFKEFKKQIPNLSLEDFKEFSPWDIKAASDWLLSIEACRNHSHRLDPMASEFFVEFVGTEDSSRLYNELLRLMTREEEITIDLIKRECQAQHNVFKLALDLAKGDSKAAFNQIHNLIREKELHPGTLAAIETSLLKHLKLKLAQQKGYNKDQKAELLGISPQRLYYQEKESEGLSIQRLENLLKAILKAERQSKTGQMQLESSMKVLAAF